MNTPTRNALLSTVATLSLLAAPAIAQDGPARGNVQLEGSIRLLPNGDGVAKIQIRFSAADYTRVKGENPNAFRYVRDFSGTRSDVEITDTSARYEDAKSSVILEMTQRGAMRNLGGGRWVLPFARGIDFINLANEAEGTVGYFVESGTWPGGIAYKGKVLYHLPKGAKEARFDNSERTLSYTLEREAKAGPAALGQKLRTKDRLMSALYKVYGLGTDFAAMWVAKSTFKNSGSSVIKDLRVRFRLSGYSDWSLWQSFAELVPDQTVVAPYYPVLEAKIATLTSNTPANLLVEWEYTDDAGQKQTSSDGRRLVVLGHRSFLFSDIKGDESFGTWHEAHANAPFVAAWVSRDDKIVSEFASMANRRAGGVGASDNDKNCLKVLGEIYRLMQVNEFTYQHPEGLIDRSVAFDPQSAQSLQYPRETIRKRSGTCIDLAILYAAMANSVGIRSYLALVPGHCFPVFRVPSGTLIGIEATGVAGGLHHGGTHLFEAVLDKGIKNLQKWSRDGRIHLLDLQDLWTRGISNPELPELPADIAKQWKLLEHCQGEEKLYGQGAGPDTGAGQGQGNDFAGTWSGTVTENVGGQQVSYGAAIKFQATGRGSYSFTAVAQAAVPNGQGGVIRVRVQSVGTGTQNGNGLQITTTRKVLTYLDTGATEQMNGDSGSFTLQNGRLVGKVGNQTDGFVAINFARK
ncbi:MAG: hypothetical protein H6836_02815 [Planctomycetes bacterium]|nr:hypothetical protein [Planctomycetota bacterium]